MLQVAAGSLGYQLVSSKYGAYTVQIEGETIVIPNRNRTNKYLTKTKNYNLSSELPTPNSEL